MHNSYAQLSYFFPDSNSCFSVSWMKFWFQGDTVIGDYKYKKVYMQANDSIADFDRAYYFAAIREDTVAEKVYFHYNDYYNGEGEYLLYDFSVNVGDVVNFYSLWGGFAPQLKERIVLSIDSILIDNYYRKKINFEYETWGYYMQPESWIEGIGSTNGLFFPGYFDEVDGMDWTVLLCVHIDGRLIYQLDDTFYHKYNCYIHEYGVNINENKKEILKIYPTIVDNMLYIETDRNIENFDYKIINVQGQVMNEGMFTSNTINVASLNKGFYFIVISDNKNKIYINAYKFIKL